MTQVFVSYRRDDTIDIAGRLYDRLRVKFSRVFLDDHWIGGGDDLPEVLERGVGSSTIVVAVIGSNWEGSRGSHRPSRIQDPDDPVRKELEWMLRRSLPILPVLVGDATMPLAERLPSSLGGLVRKLALPLRSGGDFDRDVKEIIETISELTGVLHRFRGVAGSRRYPIGSPSGGSVSRQRAGVLIGMRSGAVLTAGCGALALGRELAGWDYEIALDALKPASYLTLALTVVGTLCLLMSWVRLRVLSTVGRRRQHAAIEELATLLLSRVDSPWLLSPHATRSLALGLEQRASVRSHHGQAHRRGTPFGRPSGRVQPVRARPRSGTRRTEPPAARN